MLIISHRGNLHGPDPKTENTNEQICKALSAGYNVEVDVWFKNGDLYLGHDEPKDVFSILIASRLWFHCKNIEAVEYFIDYAARNYFYHDEDDIAVTSNKYLWTFPGKLLTSKSIAVLPETVTGWDIRKAFGLCTDYPKIYESLL